MLLCQNCLLVSAITLQHMHHCHKRLASDHGLLAQVEVQEAYGKQSPQRYPLDPPDPKSVTGEDTSTHNRGVGGPLARLPLSVQPGEVLVQVCITTCMLWLAEDVGTGVWHTLLELCPAHVDKQNSYLGRTQVVVY